jgi:hypothetical protein
MNQNIRPGSGRKEEKHVGRRKQRQVRRFLEEAFGRSDTSVVDEVLSLDFVCYDPNSEAGEVRGRRNRLNPT